VEGRDEAAGNLPTSQLLQANCQQPVEDHRQLGQHGGWRLVMLLLLLLLPWLGG
jgi:hypothetical protein